MVRRGEGGEGVGRGTEGPILFFCSLECLDCHLIVLYRASKNRIFFVPSFIQRWGTQGESKISSFFSVVNQGNEKMQWVQVFLA